MGNQTIYRILFAISAAHLVQDALQSVVPAMLPVAQNHFHLSYFQLGIIMLTINLVASVSQPLIGYVADIKPMPWVLPVAAVFSCIGLAGLASANSYHWLLMSVVFIGIGAAMFHPEGSRVTSAASGMKRGLAQSIFQVGGNGGQSLGPLFAALLFVPLGMHGAWWLMAPAAFSLLLLAAVAAWYRGQLKTVRKNAKSRRGKVLAGPLCLLVFFVTMRSWVYAGIQGFYPLYLIGAQHLSIAQAQTYSFLFLLAGAIGTFFGGPLADRLGKRTVLFTSILCSLPFTLLIPFVHGFLAYMVIFLAGLVILCSFSVTVVYAQELAPGWIGVVSGLIVGFGFGMGGIGAALFGKIADQFGLMTVMLIAGLLPLLGLTAYFLPSDKKVRELHFEERISA